MANTDLTAPRRDTFPIVVTVTSDGAAVDITGYTFFFTAKKCDTDTDAQAVITKDVTSHTNPTGGVTTITLSSADTNVDAMDYVYDIQMKDTSGNITTLVTPAGKFTIVQDITQRTS